MADIPGPQLKIITPDVISTQIDVFPTQGRNNEIPVAH